MEQWKNNNRLTDTEAKDLSNFINTIRTNEGASFFQQPNMNVSNTQLNNSNSRISDCSNTIRHNNSSNISETSRNDVFNTHRIRKDPNSKKDANVTPTIPKNTYVAPIVKGSSSVGKIIIWVAIAALAVFLISQFAGGGDKLNGTTWKYTYDAGSYTLFSFSNGTCTLTEVNIVTGNRYTDSAKYTINGNKIDFEPGSKGLTWEITGKQLIMRSNTETMIMEKQ